MNRKENSPQLAPKKAMHGGSSPIKDFCQFLHNFFFALSSSPARPQPDAHCHHPLRRCQAVPFHSAAAAFICLRLRCYHFAAFCGCMPRRWGIIHPSPLVFNRFGISRNVGGFFPLIIMLLLQSVPLRLGKLSAAVNRDTVEPWLNECGQSMFKRQR